MSADLEKLAYQAALRALDKQERLVEELRARTGLVLAASSLAVSFLGGRGSGAFDPPGLLLLAVGCFVVSVGAAIYVLLPKDSLTFSMSAAVVISSLFSFRGDAAELYRRGGDAMDRFCDENDAVIRRLMIAFSVAACALGVEVVAFAVSLGGTLI